MIEQTVKNRIKQLPDEYAQFLSSDFIKDATAAFGSELGLDEESLEYLQNGILLYLTLFINQQELADFLSRECYIPESIAVTTADAIEKSLPDDIQQAREAGYQTLHPKATAPDSNPAPTNVPDLQQEIAETSDSIKKIQSMRTMQTDYQTKTSTKPSNQPKTAVPPANTTKPKEVNNSSQPHWDSDKK